MRPKPTPPPGCCTAQEAAWRLGLSLKRLCVLVEEGTLHWQQPRRGPYPAYLSREAVERLAEQREARAARVTPGKNLWHWGNRADRARLFRGAPDAEHDEPLLSVREVADILDVSPSEVAYLADVGHLPVYQKKPGQPGSRLLFRHLHVLQYADRPETRRRHEIATRRFARPQPALAAGWDEKNIPPLDLREPSPATERDYSPFYTTRQVAHLLGVHPSVVRRMEKTGRLNGTRQPPKKRWRAWGVPDPTVVHNRWWFFKKADVHALQADPEYNRRRRIYDRSITWEAKAVREAKKYAVTEEELEACRKANALGRPPAGEFRDSGWVWGDARIRYTSPLAHDPADPPGSPWDELPPMSEL